MTGRAFEIARELRIDGTPEAVFDAVTDHTDGWLWPDTVEHRAGGSTGSGGVVTRWDPPQQYSSRMEGPEGWFNQLDFTILSKDDGTWLRYVHSGVFAGEWDAQYDGASKHTDFYLETLSQYVQYFAGRAARYIDVLAPSTSQTPEGFSTLVSHLQLAGADAGHRARVELPTGSADVTVDYTNDWFLGLRTDDSLIRVFGRNFFGAPVAVSVHHFGTTQAADIAGAWHSTLTELYR